jgi:hypothetical protein
LRPVEDEEETLVPGMVPLMTTNNYIVSLLATNGGSTRSCGQATQKTILATIKCWSLLEKKCRKEPAVGPSTRIKTWRNSAANSIKFSNSSIDEDQKFLTRDQLLINKIWHQLCYLAHGVTLDVGYW